MAWWPCHLSKFPACDGSMRQGTASSSHHVSPSSWALRLARCQKEVLRELNPRPAHTSQKNHALPATSSWSISAVSSTIQHQTRKWNSKKWKGSMRRFSLLRHQYVAKPTLENLDVVIFQKEHCSCAWWSSKTFRFPLARVSLPYLFFIPSSPPPLPTTAWGVQISPRSRSDSQTSRT